MSIRKKRGNFGEVENQFIKLKEENEKLKQAQLNSDDVEKLIYENRVLKLELQKLKSKSDFFLDPKLFDGNSSNINVTGTVQGNYNDEIGANEQNSQNIESSKNLNANYSEKEILNIDFPKEPSMGINSINNTEKKNNSVNLENNINMNNNIKNIIGNSSFSSAKKSNSNRNHNGINYHKYGNSEVYNNNSNLNDIINNLMQNNNLDLISENSTKKNQLSSKDTNENNLSLKKSNGYSSLFKAGESLVSGQFSAINNSIVAQKKNRSPDVIALRQVNDRLKYLESLEKESSNFLNKQREKIKNEKLKKEEEIKKKIEDVNNYINISKSFLFIN